MKRIGYLYEKMMTEENFILAERKLGINKPDNKVARHISANAERYGKELFLKVSNGEFAWHEPKETTIIETYKHKERHLKIPCLEDQAAQIAWLNIATPIIERKNYFYNCGSIPKAGQTRCVKALKKWLRNPKMKYGATTDIRKFYDTCPHESIRKGLERIFKDKRFVEYAMGFVSSMSNNGIGIAIGYPVSHWLANVVLMSLDHGIRRAFADVKCTRYMDDMALVSANKRHIRRAVYYIKDSTEQLGFRLKKWAWFLIKGRGLTFLSYRFFNGYTLLAKRLMYRVARRMRRAHDNLNAHNAMGITSYLGILKHCNSYNFRVQYVYPFVNKWDCIRLISEHSRKAAA